MNATQTVSPRAAWLILLAISAASFLVAEYLGERDVAVAGILAIAAAKVALVLRAFMEIRRAPRGIRVYLQAWTVACALLIYALWWAAAR